ncbi:thermonuclease family protein [Chryseobacterium sp. CFS15]|uniref:thermonuclease family protein n=1 Tax=Chryseobacterium sp. CFS15 TaxID=2986946 RepID=UPI002808DFF3|nr:thermonuclease family protein [Chryseobacterium sp. CFS15]MDQ8142354.1 thermonuclease family protein [Chryseobacterium sp. CFS15]
MEDPLLKVYYDEGKYLSEEFIKIGFGWWYYQYSTDKELGKMQETTQKNKLELWQHVNAISPYEWRKLNIKNH